MESLEARFFFKKKKEIRTSWFVFFGDLGLVGNQQRLLTPRVMEPSAQLWGRKGTTTERREQGAPKPANRASQTDSPRLVLQLFRMPLNFLVY